VGVEIGLVGEGLRAVMLRTHADVMAALVFGHEQAGDVGHLGGRAGESHETLVESSQVARQDLGGVGLRIHRGQQDLNVLRGVPESRDEILQMREGHGTNVLAARVSEEQQHDASAIVRQAHAPAEAARCGELAPDAVVHWQHGGIVRPGGPGTQSEREREQERDPCRTHSSVSHPGFMSRAAILGLRAGLPHRSFDRDRSAGAANQLQMIRVPVPGKTRSDCSSI